MNAGKSARLLQSAYNYDELGKKTILYTALPGAQDMKQGGIISSRTGLNADAFCVGSDFNFLDHVGAFLEEQGEVAAIFIDEAQFLTGRHVQQLACLVDQYKIHVNCYGLKVDFMGRLFLGSQVLIENVDFLKRIDNRCFCGDSANFNLRVINGKAVREGPLVFLGEASHIAVCRKHFISGEFQSLDSRTPSNKIAAVSSS